MEWTRQGVYGEGDEATNVSWVFSCACVRLAALQVTLQMYSTFSFVKELIVEHVVARDHGAFMAQVPAEQEVLGL